MLAGNPEAAASTLRESYATLEEMGERGFLSTIAGFLAQALCEQGEYDEAERFSRASEAAGRAGRRDVAGALAHSSRKGAGRSVETPKAPTTLAREAVRLAEGRSS